MTVNKIEVRNVYKVFGNREKAVLAMIRAGKSKDQVLAETGCVVASMTFRYRSGRERFLSSWACPGQASPRWCVISIG